MNRRDVDFMCLQRGVITNFSKFLDIAISPSLFSRFISEDIDAFLGIMEIARRFRDERACTRFVSDKFYSSPWTIYNRRIRSPVVMEYVKSTDASCRFFITSEREINFDRVRISDINMVDALFGGMCVQNVEHYHYILQTKILIPLDIIEELVSPAHVECCVFLEGAMKYIINQLSRVDYDSEISGEPMCPDRVLDFPIVINYEGNIETSNIVSHRTYSEMSAEDKNKVWFIY